VLGLLGYNYLISEEKSVWVIMVSKTEIPSGPGSMTDCCCEIQNIEERTFLPICNALLPLSRSLISFGRTDVIRPLGTFDDPESRDQVLA